MEKVLKVTEFNQQVKKFLKDFGDVIVEGEINQLKTYDPWIYITVKDENSSVRVFTSTYKINNLDTINEGSLVHIYGRPTIYVDRGEFQIDAWQILPAGDGALKAAFEALKQKLDGEGLFRPDRKRQLPAYPQNIGLITAKGSEAYNDFTKVLKERMGGIKVHFYPVSVQGRGSVEGIVQAFDFFNTYSPKLDVVVLCRGGGSLEDLQSFNDERVARAIYKSIAPVVTGVGHEGDITLVDLVADKRASTPSNAAELVVKDRKEILKSVLFCCKTIQTEVVGLLQMKDEVEILSGKLDARVETCFKELDQKIFGHIQSLRNGISSQVGILDRKVGRFYQHIFKIEYTLQRVINKLDYQSSSIHQAIKDLIEQNKGQVEELVRIVRNLDFKKLLQRGFSITKAASGKIIRSPGDVSNKEEITTVVENGRIISTVLPNQYG